MWCLECANKRKLEREARWWIWFEDAIATAEAMPLCDRCLITVRNEHDGNKVPRTRAEGILMVKPIEHRWRVFSLEYGSIDMDKPPNLKVEA